MVVLEILITFKSPLESMEVHLRDCKKKSVNTNLHWDTVSKSLFQKPVFFLFKKVCKSIILFTIEFTMCIVVIL